MSQYKVLPSYTDLTSLPDIHNLPVIFSAGVGGLGPVDDTGFQVRNISIHHEEDHTKADNVYNKVDNINNEYFIKF